MTIWFDPFSCYALPTMSFLDRFFGPTYEKELKLVRPLVDAVNAREASVVALDALGLTAASMELRTRVQGGASLDDVLPEAFALVRESAKRTLGQRHYDVQLIGGAILHRGKIAEMRTGEGKTLVGTLPTYLNALSGKGVHVVTVNDYLARRDGVWMGQVYAALGMTVGVINQSGSYRYDASHDAKVDEDAERDADGSFKVVYEFLRPCTRKEAYEADITYGTNSEFGFDYLRDNLEFEAKNLRQRSHAFAIIDEVDSILIDEARTPLIISGPMQDSENLYTIFADIARGLRADEHYTVDEKHKTIALTDLGIEATEKKLGIENIYTDKGIKYVHHLETAVRAQALYTRDKEYVVRNGEVVIVDEFTGRLQNGRRWSDGLHQAIEAKEGVAIQKETRTYASITYQNYFRMYEKLAGMTGTALTSQEEFFTVYGLDVIPVPTHRPIARKDNNDFIFQTERGKFTAIIERVKAVNATGQPILIGTASIEKNELLSSELTKAGVAHEMLNAKNHEREGEIIAEAGKKGKVTLATNMAGRGVDIKLGGPNATDDERDEIRTLGGLFVLGTERHEARRIDDQLRGRSGRQGDPGLTQFYVSMEDSLMRVFASDVVKSMMGRLGIPESEPIENTLITRSLESAQKKIEGFHFDSRKHVLSYDNVLNQQRVIMYDRRRKLLLGTHADVKELQDELVTHSPNLQSVIDTRVGELGESTWFELLRRLMLQVYDSLWVEHLEVMQYARGNVGLRAYAQQDPLIEYRREAVRLFKELENTATRRIAELIPRARIEAVQKEEAELEKTREKIITQSGTGGKEEGRAHTPVRREQTPERNEVVRITDGEHVEAMKYKKAEPLIASGKWRLVE
jgi:preprotein translocase subunit SecA